MTESIKLGPFLLNHPIATGGMAEVWSGVHESQGTPVAVKVITGAFARDPTYESAFRNEVRAVAGLYHPGIILVFDYGAIPEETAKASGGRLQAGSVYLVMELASVGCLSAIRYKQLKWTHVRDLLLSLLYALSHAHARNVIHRDIKPGNILLCSVQDIRPGVKLSDFGIAYPVGNLEHSKGVDFTSGTPGYMAPEQIEGKWRDFGPWTDLYALGCVAYELATWSKPFEATTPLSMAMAHLRGDPAPFISRVVTPSGFEEWVARLMARAPGDRFQSAAEAAWALLRLEYSDVEGGIEAVYPKGAYSLKSLFQAASDIVLSPSERTISDAVGLLSHRTTDVGEEAVTHWAETMEALPSQARSRSGDSRTSVRPSVISAVYRPRREELPMPDRWERPQEADENLQLVGAGLGLYGLREIPLVGREEERDHLWNNLKVVRNNGGCRSLLLRGVAGVGKSRLAQWLVEEAVEGGLATALTISHGPEYGGSDALAQLVAQVYRWISDDRSRTLLRIRNTLQADGVTDPYEWSALTELLVPATDEERAASESPVEFANPQERYALIYRMLVRESRDLPCILRIEDAQWSDDILDFVDYLLRDAGGEAPPILVVVTVRDEALRRSSAAEASLGRLLDAHEGRRATTLQIQRLPEVEHRKLIEDLLHLDGVLARQVRDRTEGNPMFAVQLIEDWVVRGILEVQASGFALKVGASADIPDNIHQIWTDRVEHEVTSRNVDYRHAYEMGAILGHRFSEREWRTSCRRSGIELPKNVIEDMLAGGLLQRGEQGIVFAHTMLQESLQRYAHDGGRWAEYNIAAAAMLNELYPSRRRGLSARIGRHLSAGGLLEECLEPLLTGAQEAELVGNISAALELLSLRKEALNSLRVPEDDERRITGTLLRSCVLIEAGEMDEAHLWATKAEASAKRTEMPMRRADALGWLGHIHYVRGELEDAERDYREAQSLSASIDYNQGMGNALLGLGSVLLSKGDYGEARKSYGSAYGKFDLMDAEKGMGRSLYGQAVSALKQEDYHAADVLNRRAMVVFEGCGGMDGVALCMNGLAESARFRDDLASAEEGYRKAAGMFDALGSGNATVMRMNLGLVLLSRGRYTRAANELEPVLKRLSAQQPNVFLPYVFAQLLACSSHMEEWDTWEILLQQCKDSIAKVAAVDRDIAWPLELAARLCVAAGRTPFGRAAYELSLEQWKRIGNVDEIKAISLALAEIADED